MSDPKPKPRSLAAAPNDATPLGPKGEPSPGQASRAAKRRSTRVTIDIPVEVYGQGPDGSIFHEESWTLLVNAHGALVTLATPVALEQMVLLVHEKTRNEMECRVAYRKEIEKGRAEVAVEFVTPSPRFWGIAFPPDDWNRAERKRPVSIST